jgi:hypothetical protein
MYRGNRFFGIPTNTASTVRIGIVSDFDDTLHSDSASELLKLFGVDVPQFWAGVQKMMNRGYDISVAYIDSILELAGEGRPLGPLSNEGLRDIGAKLSPVYPGLEGLLPDLNKIAREESGTDASVELYVVSGGLQELVSGVPFVKENATGVYGCLVDEDPATRVITRAMRLITFTEKTRFLFEISKGISPEESLKNPYAVNRAVTPEELRIPFQNMIYMGDGLTDVPCFSLMRQMGGLAFGVFNPESRKSAERALEQFLAADRVASMHAPKYGPHDELGSLLRAAVAIMARRAAGRTGSGSRMTPGD